MDNKNVNKRKITICKIEPEILDKLDIIKLSKNETLTSDFIEDHINLEWNWGAGGFKCKQFNYS